MYVVDITRVNDSINSYMLVGKNSMDAKSKTLNYVIDYTFAHYNKYIDYDLLDQNLNMDSFSLKEFMKNNYSIDIKNDLIIQSIYTDKDHCLFVKHFNDNPVIYAFDKKDTTLANNVLTYLVNDDLIDEYKDDLSLYEKNKLQYNKEIKSFAHKNFKCEIVSLYNGGMFLEELLNNACSLNDINKTDMGGITI